MTQITRRNFIKGTSAMALAMGASTLYSLPADAAHTAVRYRLLGKGWNDRLSKIVVSALSLAGYMSDDSVIRHAYRISPGGYHLTSGTWDRTNPNSYYRGLGYKDVLSVHLANVDLFQPIVNVSPYYRRDSSWGEAPLDKVSIEMFSNGRVKLHGEFEIRLNFYHLGSQGEGSSHAAWAGVIAHELLHNLGHSHGKGDYDDGIQINALQRAVYARAGGNKQLAAARHFRCGGH